MIKAFIEISAKLINLAEDSIASQNDPGAEIFDSWVL